MVDLTSKPSASAPATFACPYCDAELNDTALSCRCCGRDLTPVLPLLRRLRIVEARLESLEADAAARLLALPPPAAIAETAGEQAAQPAPDLVVPDPPRRLDALLIGLLALLAAHWTVVVWLDLPLSALRAASIVVPFLVGWTYLGRRPRMRWLDIAVAALFAACAVLAMNAVLGWIDSMPLTPQGTAAWRESGFYMLSIAASMASGMLLRLAQSALSTRGLMSLPRLREGILSVNGKVPMDALKAIELTILLVSSMVSAIAGLFAGFLGLTR